MTTQTSSISEIIQARNVLLKKQEDLYLMAAEQMNMSTRELLKNDFGHTLLSNSARDLAGEIVRRYFDMGDCYITVDQLYDRIMHFSYDNDIDLLASDENIRKSYYNMEDAPNSASLSSIAQATAAAQKKLFTEDRKTDKLDRQGKAAYREQYEKDHGELRDELTGKADRKPNGRSELHADHIQARESAMYNSRYLKENYVEEMKRFYNSADNMQLIHASANTSKGDVRVCQVDGTIKYLNARSAEYQDALKKDSQMDITYKATPDQLVEATVHQLESVPSDREGKGSSKIAKLKETGYLDENGKVKKSVKEQLKRNITNSENKESIIMLRGMDYGQVGSDSLRMVKQSMPQIIAGQLLYYGMPPVIFEAKSIIKTKNITLDIFVEKLKKSCKRIIHYIKSKIGDILKNIAGNAISKFLKSFFDIVISVLKATVKRIASAAKQVVMSLVSCVRTIADKNMSAAQKADAVTKTLAVVISGIVLELLFEYMEKQFGLPDFLMEPLQIVVTILSTNAIMLILQKLDLFNVQYGFLIANMERVFNETNEQFITASDELIATGEEEMKQQMQKLNDQIHDITETIQQLDFYKESAQPQLQQMSDTFAMGIDFDTEWEEFITA